MQNDPVIQKSEAAKREELILSYWREHAIFQKSLEKESPKGDFVFYDGPPFATGLPHAGNLLSSVIKDVIPRYKTMQGYHVRRRWGWDCHGLPIESLVEKKLGLKSKKDIETLGAGAFNEAAKSMVLEYASDWEQYIERIGRWTEFENSYKTMDNSYIESVWWGISTLHKKNLLYEGRKVLMYCPHCETPLAKAEIAMDNSYEDVTEEAVTVKLRVTPGQKIGDWVVPENTFILAWTTTPWTLPGNVALAVGEEIEYSIVKLMSNTATSEGGDYPTQNNQTVILAHARLPHVVRGSYTDLKNIKGTDLVGLSYEPLFPIEKVSAADIEHKAWKVYAADFVTTDSGTGVVHTAVIYGEDDYQLGVKEKLPMVPLLNASGRFNSDAPKSIQGKYFKYHKRGFCPVEKGEDAEHFIKKDLAERNLLFEKQAFTHSYPHCYRCGTPLIYNAITSWFINIQAVKEKMLKSNSASVHWHPEHLKHGRFQNIVENAPDWTISRNRYWASPLPIWRNETTGEITSIGSLSELAQLTLKSGNRYFVMRHGESVSNVNGQLNRSNDPSNILTPKGVEEVKRAVAMLREIDVTQIYTSPLARTRQTADLIALQLGLPKEAVIVDDRILETNGGEYDQKSIAEYHSFFKTAGDKVTKAPNGGETWHDMKTRITNFLYDLESRIKGTNIVIVSHSGPLQMLFSGALGFNDSETATAIEDARFALQNAEIREIPFVPLPHNASYELDLHRPYIDQVVLGAPSGERLVRIPEVVDCWVESGSMPFAELGYLGEGSINEALFTARFPGDFIAEYIAQTRTWFYYMHAMGILLFDSPAFKNVVSTGTILAADGSKMSKSKGNYTDPLVVLDRFGADALRFYLMGSVVMQAEDLKFRDEELADVHNRVVNILWNTYKFYDLFKNDFDVVYRPEQSTHLLDRWVLSRLGELLEGVTAEMDLYHTVRALRHVSAFIDDFSTWYVRRSRERIKSDESEDRHYALSTLRHVLIELSKIIAPIMPFIAESIYQGVGGDLESVHLESWPQSTNVVDVALVQKMQVVRSIVSLALNKRSSAGIKVRQPLGRITINNDALINDEALLAIIREEVNVKSVIIDLELGEGIVLDTTITPELKEEGDARELLRAIQELRKKNGFVSGEPTILNISGDAPIMQLLERNAERIQKLASISTIRTELGEEEITIGIHRARLGLSRLG